MAIRKQKRIIANSPRLHVRSFSGRENSRQLAPKDKYADIRIVLEFTTVIALLISLAISCTQMRSAQRKEADATEALGLANAALQTAQEAQALVDRQQMSLRDLKAMGEINSQRARISYLTLKAENGDRSAFNELHALASSTRGDYMRDPETPEYKNIQRVLDVYRGDEINDGRVNMAAKIPPHDGGNFSYGGLLDSINQESRAYGLSAVRHLRLYKHVPKLIEMIETEDDMHVLQLIGIVLTELLQPEGLNQTVSIYDLAVTPESTVEELQEFWNSNSNQLMRVKPWYWKKVKNPPYADKWVLTNPNTEKNDSEASDEF